MAKGEPQAPVTPFTCPHCGNPLEFQLGTSTKDGVLAIVVKVK